MEIKPLRAVLVVAILCSACSGSRDALATGIDTSEAAATAEAKVAGSGGSLARSMSSRTQAAGMSGRVAAPGGTAGAGSGGARETRIAGRAGGASSAHASSADSIEASGSVPMARASAGRHAAVSADDMDAGTSAPAGKEAEPMRTPQAGRGSAGAGAASAAGADTSGAAAAAAGGGGSIAVEPAGAGVAPFAANGGGGGDIGMAGATGGASVSTNGAAGIGGTWAAASGGATTSVGGAGGPAVSFPALDVARFGKPIRIPSSQSFSLAEGPLWDSCGNRLLFSDVSANTIYALSLDDQVSVFATNTLHANGLAFDVDGSLIMAQMGNPPHIARLDKTGRTTTLEPADSKLHTPDDVIVRSDGTVYFSDGDFPPTGGLTLGPLPVYALRPDTNALQNGGSVRGPNGIELSPDEKTLYVDAFYEGNVVKFTVGPDGSLSKGDVLASGLSSPDSLCLDEAGNLYVAVSRGLMVLSPEGAQLGLLSVPGVANVTNCTFGGLDGKTLYITAYTSIWKLPGMPIAGLDWRKNSARLTCQ